MFDESSTRRKDTTQNQVVSVIRRYFEANLFNSSVIFVKKLFSCTPSVQQHELPFVSFLYPVTLRTLSLSKLIFIILGYYSRDETAMLVYKTMAKRR